MIYFSIENHMISKPWTVSFNRQSAITRMTLTISKTLWNKILLPSKVRLSPTRLLNQFQMWVYRSNRDMEDQYNWTVTQTQEILHLQLTSCCLPRTLARMLIWILEKLIFVLHRFQWGKRCSCEYLNSFTLNSLFVCMKRSVNPQQLVNNTYSSLLA